jgi:hypothetical protein
VKTVSFSERNSWNSAGFEGKNFSFRNGGISKSSVDGGNVDLRIAKEMALPGKTQCCRWKRANVGDSTGDLTGTSLRCSPVRTRKMLKKDALPSVGMTARWDSFVAIGDRF